MYRACLPWLALLMLAGPAIAAPAARWAGHETGVTWNKVFER